MNLQERSPVALVSASVFSWFPLNVHFLFSRNATSALWKREFSDARPPFRHPPDARLLDAPAQQVPSLITGSAHDSVMQHQVVSINGATNLHTADVVGLDQSSRTILQISQSFEAILLYSPTKNAILIQIYEEKCCMFLLKYANCNMFKTSSLALLSNRGLSWLHFQSNPDAFCSRVVPFQHNHFFSALLQANRGLLGRTLTPTETPLLHRLTDGGETFRGQRVFISPVSVI